MNKYKEKRDSLELFLKEQIIGPGSCNLRYFFLKDKEHNSILDFDISKESAINDLNEVISDVPAYKYSSGILYPKIEVLSDDSKEDETDDEINTELSEEEIKIVEDNETINNEDNYQDGEEGLLSKQQNYPNTCGLSFVISTNNSLVEDIEVQVNYRKYTYVSRQDAIKNVLAYRIIEYKNDFKRVILEYFNDYLYIEELGKNIFLCAKPKINEQDSLYEIDYIHYNDFLKNEIIPLFKEYFGDSLKLIDESSNQNYNRYGIDKNHMFYGINKKKITKTNEYNDVISIYDISITKFLKEKLEDNLIEYKKMRLLISRLEFLKQLKEVIDNIKLIFKSSKNSLWKSKYYSHNLKLSEEVNNKINFRSEVLDIEGVDDLKYTYQYLENNGKKYIKVLLINDSVIQIKDRESRYLNKKNEANRKAYFGVELKIKELKSNVFKQYNPPNLIDFDEEDSLNKLLYRQYIDYGEGYNTSIDWGKENEYRYISTNYLPNQETPKVDSKPSKIIGNKIHSRIKDDTCLSMRALSTFSNITNKQIIEYLNEFIDSYKLWIDEKKLELKNNNDLIDKKLLDNQLNAIDQDYRRLKRNIQILGNDLKAMCAFRVMNSVMFMQLHHKLKIENDNIFIPQSNDSNYYADLNLDNEYKWRSFQLAFILLNIDAFVKPDRSDKTVENVFGKEWPERNEIADMIWFPTGGGKTEAYLGIIAFCIAYRRFTKGKKANGTTVLMRYTLRLLTLQQFQRATMLICALEVFRNKGFEISKKNQIFFNLGSERITIGLFVGEGSLPNKWEGMREELKKIKKILENNKKKEEGEKNAITTKLPFTKCPWCGSELFVDSELENVCPNKTYGINDSLKICCHTEGCAFEGTYGVPTNETCLPLRLFDSDIYKFPPTLLFGTVDKFAVLANKVSNSTSNRDEDSRRLIGKGYQNDNFPPELIIQDELHLLLGPLGTAVGLYEKAIDILCSYHDEGILIRPKIITSTATTRNTDKQVFALFNRRSEIFPKQGISCDDSFFSFYKRNENDLNIYESNRKYVGVLPVGKTQVWMQLRIASIILAHRVKYLKEKYSLDDIFSDLNNYNEIKGVMDYYHSVLSYYNSLKDVGKTQSQLYHYLPQDLNYLIKETLPWSFINTLITKDNEIDFLELTGRLNGEEVKTNLAKVQKTWTLFSGDDTRSLTKDNPPEFIIATNMISVGLDVSRFNSLIISSMPRNIAEYIQASSRVARDREGLVITVHHPFRSRDISHYQKFKEFHEKFYSYVEPISVTPFAKNALERYFAMFLAVLVRHSENLGLTNNENAKDINEDKIINIKTLVLDEIEKIKENASKLNSYLKVRTNGVKSNIEGIIDDEEFNEISNDIDNLLDLWLDKIRNNSNLKYRDNKDEINSLFINNKGGKDNSNWNVKNSLREIAPSTVIKTVQQ